MNLHNLATGAFGDIPFDGNGDLDSASINRFCGTSTCALNVWYDQSGNGTDLTVTYSSPHGAVLGTCGPNGRYCIRLDGYEVFLTPSNFFFYSFTAGVNAVMQVDESTGGPYETYAALSDGITSAANTPALWAAIQGLSPNNSQIGWLRNNSGAQATGIPSNSLFSVFSWGDSYFNRFALSGNYLPNLGVVPAPFDAQPRFHAYQFQLGLMGQMFGAPGAASAFSEVMLWDAAYSGGNLRAIGESESAYFGTPNAF
jgi:hypothetical protein